MSNQKHTDKVHDTFPAILIFSVFQAKHCNTQNANADNNMVSLLAEKNIPFKRLQGCYNGWREMSYIVPKSFAPFVEVQCAKNNQSNFLLVDQFRNASLITKDREKIDQGKFQRITKAEAVEAGNWTLDGSQYWGTK